LHSQRGLRKELLQQVFGTGASLEEEKKRVTFQYFEGRHVHIPTLNPDKHYLDYKLYKPTDAKMMQAFGDRMRQQRTM